MMFGGEFFLLLYSFAFVVVGVLCLSSSPLVASAAATPSIKAKANNYYQNNNNKNNNNNNWAEQSRRYLQEDSGVNETETVTVTVNDNAEVVNLEDDNDNKVCHIPTNWDPDKPVGGGGIDIKPKYTVGVLAIRGFDAAYAEFNATFNEYLTATAGQKFDPPIEFELKPLDFLTLFSDAEFRQVDFIYVNPSAYSCIESEYKSYSLASQVSRRKVKGQIYDLEKFGGVIATLSNRDDINTVLDLKDQRVAAASISGLGSGQMQFKAMIDNGMNYLDDPKQLVFTSNQGLVVKGLLAGQFDVGFIRTDQLERSKDADGNPVDINKFKVINPQPDLEINGVKFPFNSSTELYAEWNIAALTHVSQDVSREVQQAMLNVATYADIGKSVDRCYQTNINSTTVDCNQIPLSKLYTSGPIPCGVTNDIAVKALNAQTNGKYAEWTTSLSYMQLRSMQEAVGFIKKDPESLTWRCIRSAELYDAISCPDGYSLKSKEEVDTACAISGLDCGEGFQCICRPCEMPYERQCIDSVPIGERCVELYIFIPSIILPILLLVGIIVHYYVEYKRKQSDSVWIVKIDELDFGDGSATIIGQGTFGLVLLAEYRGTQVAVKRVIPPGTERDSLFDPRKSTSKWSASVDSWGGGGSILEDVENGNAITGPMNRGMKSRAPNTIMNSMMRSEVMMSSQYHRKRGVLGFCFDHKGDDNTQIYLKSEFVAEIRQLARLRHPCITTVMGAVMPSRKDDPMLIMEYMRYGSLFDVLQDDSIILKPEQILDILKDVAQGLRFLHSANPPVIHGDLKSQNVLVDENLCAKVTDFGLSGKTHIGAVGTPFWMSPELLQGNCVNSPESDIYALGIVIYEIYSGRPPYEGEKYSDVVKQVCNPKINKRPPVPLHCPSKVAKLMNECFARDPLERPSAEYVDMALKVEMKVTERTSRLEALNADLAIANNKIASSSAMQLQHFASMSHEIRTPLNCIIGLSSLIEDTELDEMQKESMGMIVSSGKLLRQIVDDVLDYSKLESGKVEILVKEVNFQETLGAVIHLVKTSQIAVDKSLNIIATFDPLLPECIATDSRRVQQILYNLLGNAIKFSNEESRIDFNVAIADDKKMLILSVKDYGKGIGSEDYAKIFEPFRQSVTGLTNTVGGTGLGLSITKKLVEAMDGKISVDSEVGSWTDFKVEIPFVDRPINIEEFSDRLGSTSIFFVADETDPQTTLVQNIFAAFMVNYAHFHNMDDLVKIISSDGALVPEMTYICLVHEDLYDAKSFELLKENSRSCVVTFGPKYGIEKTRKHWRSLMEVFPSVLIQYLGDFAQELLGNPAKACSRALGDEGDELISGLRILIAEDNLVNQKVLKRLLNRCGVTMITIANNGLEAVEMEAKQPFDLVLMDMQMPKMDGVEACRALNQRDGGHPIPRVIFVTAHVSDSFRQYCIDNGAAGYLPKPCSLDSIREVLRHMVGYGSRFSFVYPKSWNKCRHSQNEKKVHPPKTLTFTTTK